MGRKKRVSEMGLLISKGNNGIALNQAARKLYEACWTFCPANLVFSVAHFSFLLYLFGVKHPVNIIFFAGHLTPISPIHFLFAGHFKNLPDIHVTNEFCAACP